MSIDRKIKAILAFRIERVLSKKDFRALFKSNIFGKGSYGIASTNLRYFSKPISDLCRSCTFEPTQSSSKYNPYKGKLAKFRRNLVLNNLLDNKFINKNEHLKLINSEIKLKKRKRIYLEDSRYYVEDVRKFVIDNYGFDKVYKQGFNIKTPLDLQLQKIATHSLRKGLQEFDKRKGWRGPLSNIKKHKNWKKDLKNLNLEKSLGWELAVVNRIDKFETVIETQSKNNGTINFNDIEWTRKEFKKMFKIGDIIYVKKLSDGNYSLKQLPIANGVLL